jgi:hypothetical protein
LAAFDVSQLQQAWKGDHDGKDSKARFLDDLNPLLLLHLTRQFFPIGRAGAAARLDKMDCRSLAENYTPRDNPAKDHCEATMEGLEWAPVALDAITVLFSPVGMLGVAASGLESSALAEEGAAGRVAGKLAPVLEQTGV